MCNSGAEADGDERDVQACREAALRFLDRRPHTILELRRKLSRKGFAQTPCDAVLADFTRLGLLDDGAYAEQYRDERRAGSRICGVRKIEAELRRRGVSNDILRTVLRDEPDGDDGEYNRAVTAARAKLRLIIDRSDRRKTYAKLCRFLANRGFAPAVCRNATERVLSNPGEEDAGLPS